MRFALILMTLLLWQSEADSQNTIGIPDIINYTKQQYNAGSQNWNIQQDSRGITYFANNNGLLSFDGATWRLFTLPNKRIVRSLYIDASDCIYVGGQSEIGYFSPATNGDLAYTSLNKLIPKESNDFADVWNIVSFNGDIYFRSNRKIFRLHNRAITAYNSINWSFLGVADNRLFAFDYSNGLVTLGNHNWQTFIKKEKLPADIQISSLLPVGDDSLLMPSLTNGLFLIHDTAITPFQTPALQTIAAANIYAAKLLSKTTIAFATNLAGCFITTTKGDFIQKISKSEGLQNNNVLSIFFDRNENIWLGLDNGIDLITYNNAIKNIFPEPNDRNAGYTSLIFKNHLYLGTSTGLYSADAGNSKDISFALSHFDFIRNTTGQVWNVSEVNRKLLMGHNKGGFLIDNNNATLIDKNTTGFWTFLPLYNTMPSSVMIAGTYNGINFYKDSANTFVNTSVHSHFESARFVSIDSNCIWIAHPYKGLYKVEFDKNKNPFYTTYSDVHHILSDNHNHIFKIKNRTVLTNSNGIFEYDREKNDFAVSAYFQHLFGKLPVSYLYEDKYGNIWFTLDRKPGVIDMSGTTPKTIYFPELNNKILSDDYENIYVADSNNVFIAAEKGFFHINYPDYKKHKYSLQVLIRMVKIFNHSDSIIYGGYKPVTDDIPSVNHSDNSLHLEFSSTLYGQPRSVEYSYYLEGFDKGWLGWTNKTEKDYTNLPAGTYTFKVKCHISNDNESPVATYRFEILPPWYQTIWAYLFYLLLLAGGVFLVHKRQVARFRRRQQQHLEEQQRRYEDEQRQLQYQYNLEIEKNDREIVQLKNEKLQAEIERKNREEEQKRLRLLHQIEAEKNERELITLRNEKLNIEITNKNAELASNAMILVQKGELLQKIKDELTKLKKNAEIEQESKDYKRIIKIIDNELDNNHEWEHFAVHFDDVHTGYLKHLKEVYPDLTPTELKLCAYLRLNLSTKEIAQLMNISVRGVETSRYRLRKKLDIGNETSLFDFLINVK